MNIETLKGKWIQVKGQIKQEWPELSHSDINYINGKFDRLVGKLQEHYGYTAEEAEEKIQALSQTLGARAKETALFAESKIKNLGNSINNQIRKSPWTIAAATTILGLVVGILVKKKFR